MRLISISVCALFLWGCAGSNVMSQREPVSASAFATVDLTVLEQNQDIDVNYLDGLLSFPAERFRSVSAVLMQRSPETCRLIDIPTMKINRDKPKDSVRINADMPISLRVFHRTDHGKQGESSVIHFVPKAGGRYAIVDIYDSSNRGVFKVTLAEREEGSGRFSPLPMNTISARVEQAELFARCRTLHTS